MANRLRAFADRLNDDLYEGLSDQQVGDLCDLLADLCTELDRLDALRQDTWWYPIVYRRAASRILRDSRDIIEDFVEAQMLSLNSAFAALVQKRVAEVEALYGVRGIESRCHKP